MAPFPPKGAPALGRPGGWLKSSPLIEAQFAAIRQRVAYLEQDRYLAPDIESMREWAQQSAWPAALAQCLPSHA